VGSTWRRHFTWWGGEGQVRDILIVEEGIEWGGCRIYSQRLDVRDREVSRLLVLLAVRSERNARAIRTGVRRPASNDTSNSASSEILRRIKHYAALAFGGAAWHLGLPLGSHSGPTGSRSLREARLWQ